MIRLTNLANKYQKRLIRPIYAQTQATPYSTSLDEQVLTGPNAVTGRTSFKNADGSRYLPLNEDTSPLGTRSASAFTTKGSLVPGTVMVRTEGELVAVATGPDSGVERPFGLLANFIGGELDDTYGEDQIAVWRGAQHAFFELLKPAWNDTGLASALNETANKKGGSVLLYAQTDGRLGFVSSPNAARIPVARVIERPTSARLLIELLV